MFPNHMQASGDRRSRACGCNDVSMIDVEHRWVHLDPEAAVNELRDHFQMRYCRSPIQQSGVDDGKCTIAQPNDHRPTHMGCGDTK